MCEMQTEKEDRKLALNIFSHIFLGKFFSNCALRDTAVTGVVGQKCRGITRREAQRRCFLCCKLCRSLYWAKLCQEPQRRSHRINQSLTLVTELGGGGVHRVPRI